jgi:hypothetical protein
MRGTRIIEAKSTAKEDRMHPETRYLFIASMDVAPEKEALFNEVYDAEHIPLLLKVPGVLSAVRCVNEPLTLAIAGERRNILIKDEPRYSAMYELASAEVLVSDAWAKAVDQGRWPSEVRPYLRNHRHVLRKIMRDGRGS